MYCPVCRRSTVSSRAPKLTSLQMEMPVSTHQDAFLRTHGGKDVQIFYLGHNEDKTIAAWGQGHDERAASEMRDLLAKVTVLCRHVRQVQIFWPNHVSVDQLADFAHLTSLRLIGCVLASPRPATLNRLTGLTVRLSSSCKTELRPS